MASLFDWLFGRVVQLDMDADGPPWPLRVHNADSGNYELIGGELDRAVWDWQGRLVLDLDGSLVTME